MKRIANQIFVVAVLLALMIGLDQLKAGGAAQEAPLTLAAIGFVVLAAFTLAELGAALTLPKVTGFILAGIALGPYAGNVLSREVVQEMKMFNDLALGLIATSAGLELDGKGILRMWRSLSATVALKVLLLPIAVGGTFYALQTGFHVLPLESDAAVIGAAGVFSALAVGTSPAIALAVLSETKAKGKLSELTLGLAVLKDAVVVVCLAVAVAVALSLTAPDAALGAEVFVEVGKHLGEEVLLGLALAIFLVLYMRFIGAEMLLFVAAMILVVTQVTEAFHLQPLLVFIVAGFVVRNFTRYEHTLLHPLEVVALPVFVVFFANAGASVDLDATLAILPFALALCLTRAAAFYVAGRFGAAAGGLPLGVQNVAWMAYLPQAGVTLGLVGIAAGQLTQFATSITNTGMAVVAVNLLVGPITLRLALRMAGEIPEARAEEEEPTAEVSAETEEGELPPKPELAVPGLQEELDRIDAAMRSRTEAFVEETVVPWAQSLGEAIDKAIPEHGEPSAAEPDDAADETTLRRLIDVARHAHEQSPSTERAEALRRLFEGLRAVMNELPLDHVASLERRHLSGMPDDSLLLRARKQLLLAGTMLGRARQRTIPLRMGCRLAMEPSLAAGTLEALGSWCRTEAAVLAELRQLAEGHRGPDEVRSGVVALLEAWVRRMRNELVRSLRYGLGELAPILLDAGTPALPVKRLRFSRVEPIVTRDLGELERSGRRWEPALEAAANSLDVTVRAELLQRRTLRLVESGFVVPLSELLDSIEPEVEATRDRLGEARAAVAAMTEVDRDELAKLTAASRKAFPQEAHVRIKKMRARFKEQVSEQRLANDLRRLVEELPERMTILGGETPLQFARSPASVELVDAPLRRASEEALIVDLLPVVGERVREASALVTAVNSQLREHVSVATFALDTAVKSEDEDEEKLALAADGLERSIRRIDELGGTLERIREETPAQVQQALANAFTSVREGVARVRVDVTRRRSPWDSVRRRVARAFEWVSERFGGLRGRLRRWIRKLRQSDLTQELQTRAGRTRLDAAGLRELLYAEVRREDQPPLPPIYGRLFTLEPIHDRRFFAVHRNELRALVKEEHAALEGRSDGVLVVGEHGTGRTSLLNVAQLEFRAPRVLRLGQEQARAGGFLPVLATELQCEPTPGDVRGALAEERTTVIVDDLELWFVPEPGGIGSLEPILDLVLTTRHVAFWVVTMSKDALVMVDPLFAVRQAFGRVITLGSLDEDALAHAVEARNRISGLEIVYPRRRFAGFLGERRAERRRGAYYRNLARTSHGNLRAALRAWYRDVEPGPGDVIRPHLRSTVLGQYRFLEQLHAHALAILVEASRFGVLEVGSLCRTLELSRGEVSRHLAFLRAAGILERRAGIGGGLRIAPAVQPTITRALIEAGALRRSP